METTTIAGVPVARPPQPRAHKTSLDQADFLKLLTAQLRNQDPTKPVDNAEYVAQLAQFSTVEGIGRSNSALDRIVGQLDALVAALSPRTAGPASAAAQPAAEPPITAKER